jgi:nitrogen regulatory protein PII
MTKMVMVVYNEALDTEVMEVLENCGLKNYTQLTGIFGRGSTSGTHLGNDIWPGRNNILYVACDEKQARQILIYVKELRKKIGHEGIKAFLLPVEEVT